MPTVAESIVTALADHGVTQVWGVVGDALNPVTEAIRQDDRVEWVGVRHEEAAAFAVSAQAQLTGRLGVCMGTVGPGSIHLLNGLYDAKKSHAPVLAICGQVPSEELGSDFFQEVDNDRLFADVAVFAKTRDHAGPAAAAPRAGRERRARPSGRGRADAARRPRRPGAAQGRTPGDVRAAGPLDHRARGPDLGRRDGSSTGPAPSRCWSGWARATPASRCWSWPTGCRRRWCSPSRPRRGSSATTASRSGSPG